MNSLNPRDRSFVVRGIIAAALLTALGASGCSRNRVYTVNSLPDEFEFRPVVNPRILPLGCFGPPVSVDPQLIDVGDELSISIAAGLDQESQSTVLVRLGDDGTAWLPEIGQVRLVGLHPIAAEQQIVAAAKQRDVYRQPSVTVAIKSRHTNTITVMGAVARTSVVAGVRQDTVHEIPWRLSYLKTVIDAAGGLSENAGTTVWIWRPVVPESEPQMLTIDLNDPEDRRQGSPYLPDGTVVTVDERPPKPIQLEGLVSKPGPVDYSVVHGIRLVEAVNLAGGPASKVASDVVITRESADGQQRCDIKANLDSDADKNFQLMPADIVRVKQTPATWGLDIARTFLRFSIGSNVAFP